MNGREPDSGTLKARFWAAVDRWSKVAVLLVIPMLGWVLRVELFMAPGERFTANNAHTLELEMQKYVQTEIAKLPPEPFREKVGEIKRRVDANSDLLQDLRADVAVGNSRLEAIEALLRDR